MSRSTPPPDECANCGESIPRNARACPECGADERTGWRETSIYDDLDLPDEHDSTDAAKARRPVNIFWILVGVGMLVLLGLAALGLRL
ncbi:zinc ribbon domain-containing protein [Rariglobus hedericola]|uniref:Zinc ribbon domain-containing protein n=1 Tax=Rariglobus hedericola TaxID=2597822 RepID=A0A556QND4_9BACT|nr:zinc ribbon domain-containing protein [Rariglobus hedericola]TSJ78137.1 zinc ribbon domain-containing protein [Rariglobus hedericola]